MKLPHIHRNGSCNIKINLYLIATSGGERSVHRVERHRIHWENLVPLAVALERVLVFLYLLR